MPGLAGKNQMRPTQGSAESVGIVGRRHRHHVQAMRRLGRDQRRHRMRILQAFSVDPSALREGHAAAAESVSVR